MQQPSNQQQANQLPSTDAFAQAPPTGGETASSAIPNMIGDLFPAQISGPLTATQNGVTTTLPRFQRIPSQFNQPGTVFNFDIFFFMQPSSRPMVLTAGTPLPRNSFVDPLALFVVAPSGSARSPSAGVLALIGRGAFKVTENESPRPQDRVFTTYNYYNNVDHALNPPSFPRTDVHREVIGFEKTFLDGNASFGVRLPFLELTGDTTVEDSNVGDVSLVFKYAFLNDPETGNVLSGGLVLTVPTGPSFLPSGIPDIHPFLFQPYVGAIYCFGDAYVQGFSSVVVPTDDRDLVLLFNDLAVGYFLCRNREGRFITDIVPTLEGHLNSPLNHRGSMSQPIGGIDVFDLTAGTTFVLHNRATLTLGVATPLTGPKPFDVEAQVQFNYRF